MNGSAAPSAPSVLVAGLGKTGTTGAYNAAKTAMNDQGWDVACLFEPRKAEPLLALGRYQPYRPILAKVMVDWFEDAVPRPTDFDRRVMTVRDPRDVVISRLLFRPLIRPTVRELSTEVLETFLGALREKEADPASWSVKGLHDLADRLGIKSAAFGSLLREQEKQVRILERHDFFVLRYEAFVEGRLDELSDYLGFGVTNPAATGAAWLSHIARSMSHGAWRHWFTDEDVDFFGRMFADYLERFGYRDWDRADRPEIDPEDSSDYLERRLVQRRAQVEHRYDSDWTPETTTEPEQVNQLREMADDGDAVAAVRLARVLDLGKATGAPDRDGAIAAAREAAVRGHLGAMELLAGWLEARPDRRDVLEGRMWARETHQLRRRAELEERIQRLERELEQPSGRADRIGRFVTRILRRAAQTVRSLRNRFAR